MTAAARLTKICFAGFMQDEKDALKKRAVDAGMVPVGAVSKSLGYLVAGPYCEPRMRVHAAGYEIPVIELGEFERLLDGRAADRENAGLERPSLSVGQRLPMPRGVHVALSFETADRYRDSACAVGMVRIEDGVVASLAYSLIRPPRALVEFSHIHGLTWDELGVEKPFAEVWRSLGGVHGGAEYFICHNAILQKAVLAACCEKADIRPPDARFIDTLRGVWQQVPGANSYCLSSMCEVYGIPLNRHQAMSDAMAAALLFSRLHEAGVSRDAISVPGLRPFPKGDGKPALDRATAVAVREFLGIAKGFVADGVLTEEEMACVLEWLEGNAHLEDSPHFAPLFEMAWLIVEDDIMTDEELDEMRRMLELWIAVTG